MFRIAHADLPPSLEWSDRACAITRSLHEFYRVPAVHSGIFDEAVIRLTRDIARATLGKMSTNLSETVPLEGLVSRETQKRLERFVSMVIKWNPTIKLISPADEARLWTRHINDSLTVVALLPDNITRVIDLGSGGGFPGLVIAAVTGAVVELVEADRRKAVFLTEAAREMGVSVLVHATRIENVQLPASSLVTARALAPLAKLLAYAHPLLTFDGTCLFSKGPNPEDEILAARKAWRFEDYITQTPVGTIISIRNVERI